jgi:hypothetical protein
MFIERVWEDGKRELINMEVGTVLRIHEGLPSCWFLEVDAGGKTHVLQQNNSITIIHNQYKALKEQWVGSKNVFVIAE